MKDVVEYLPMTVECAQCHRFTPVVGPIKVVERRIQLTQGEPIRAYFPFCSDECRAEWKKTESGEPTLFSS